LAASNRYDLLKRLIDILGAAALVVVLSPVLLLVAVIVVLDVGFPIVFWQMRPGRYGYPFKVYKFRTMRGAHTPDGSRVADPERTSRFGRLLRRYRLDELPQLLNVLVGDMSFVGPRPLLAADINSDAGTRLSVRPGVTGWAQVNGGRELSSDEKAALDVWYVRHRSLALDLRILFRTLSVLQRGEVVDRRAIKLARENSALP
jgi:lipopolysaccharide/colanic/teichoic acid biosynthesis glycosyltransferase